MSDYPWTQADETPEIDQAANEAGAAAEEAKQAVPFAPHSPGWTRCKDARVCYAVLDGRKIDRDHPEELDKVLAQSAGEFLGSPAEFNDGLWAGDFFCGEVLVIYYQVKEADDGE